MTVKKYRQLRRRRPELKLPMWSLLAIRDEAKRMTWRTLVAKRVAMLLLLDPDEFDEWQDTPF